jgi:hypothetical protein
VKNSEWRINIFEEALNKPNLTEERRSASEQKRQFLGESRINGQLALVLKLTTKTTDSREQQDVAAS